MVAKWTKEVSHCRFTYEPGGQIWWPDLVASYVGTAQGGSQMTVLQQCWPVTGWPPLIFMKV
jgi:hypothetical protein